MCCKWSVTASLVWWCAGVSCDACGKSNFPGKRYKCLICYDFDLCSDCYDGGQEGGGSGPHEVSHPMQCILTRVDAGEWREGMVMICAGVASVQVESSLPSRAALRWREPLTGAVACNVPHLPTMWSGWVL